MAGHSHAANIKHRKGAQDAKRSKIFTKVQTEIYSAVKMSGSDVSSNPRLKLAISKAKSLNMPKDKIEAAILRATNASDQTNYDSTNYLGHLSGGVAVLVECLTDNKNRTAGEVRSTITKAGGNMGESSAIDFLFSHLGFIKYNSNQLHNNFEKFFDLCADLGCDDIYESSEIDENENETQFFCATTELKDFAKIRDEIEKSTKLEAVEATLIWKANTTLEVLNDVKHKIEDLTEKLEDLDDVQSVWCNIF